MLSASRILQYCTVCTVHCQIDTVDFMSGPRGSGPEPEPDRKFLWIGVHSLSERNRTVMNLEPRFRFRVRFRCGKIPRTGPMVLFGVWPEGAQNRTEPNFCSTGFTCRVAALVNRVLSTIITYYLLWMNKSVAERLVESCQNKGWYSTFNVLRASKCACRVRVNMLTYWTSILYTFIA